eukprot:4959143-Pyramimonas_sp.AAC.1
MSTGLYFYRRVNSAIRYYGVGRVECGCPNHTSSALTPRITPQGERLTKSNCKSTSQSFICTLAR